MITESAELSKQKLLAGKHTDLLLDIGSTLLASGASSERIDRNLKRIGSSWGYDVDIFFDYTGLIITIQSKDEPLVYATRHKKLHKHHVNFNILKDISLLSWKVKEDGLNQETVDEAMEGIKSEPSYSRILVLFGIGAACFALCMIAGGDIRDALVTFVAGFCGMFVRQEIDKRGYLSMLAILGASFTSSMIASLDAVFHIGSNPEPALATCILYLVPGVQMINCVIDMIEGYFPMALARGAFSTYILLWMAVGMSLSILIFGMHNF
ncbi:MAG: threonine/serine exporter family protein [Niabella sp.]